jgi:hypothetical protein
MEYDKPAWYEIRFKGQLDTRWADRFDPMRCTHARDGATILTGPVIDQAALYGVLRAVRDLGLPLISVIQIDPPSANGPDDTTDTDH